MGNDRTEKRERIITLACAFALPVLLGAAAFAVVGIYPFGEKSLLIADMNSEYIEYLSRLNAAARGSGSLLRSWNMGMGLNMLGLIAFYISSPFNIIVMLMPLSLITEAVFIITLLKFGLCGLLFAVFARSCFPGTDKIFHVVFAVAYALSAYNIAYSSNIMWLDGAAFLPLVLLGAEKILSGGRCKIFILSLVYVFFTSYYIGFMIGIFSFLYFTARYFSQKNNFKEYIEKLGFFLGSAVLAAGCCAFLLLPAFLNLKNGQSEMWNLAFDPKLKYPVVRLAAKLLPGAYDSLTDSGLPNIYCTVAALSLMFLYFRTKAIVLREKLVFGGFAGFMLLSFSCNFLDLAWHAFEDPTWYPARYSFVFSFLTLYLALRCASVIREITRGEVFSALFFVLILFIEIAINRFGFIKLRQCIIGGALACTYALMVAYWNKRRRSALSVLLVLLVCMESFFNAGTMIEAMDRQFEYKNRAAYRDFNDRYAAAVNRLGELDGGVYRTEAVQPRNANGAMALGFNGISHYSTTTDQALNGFLRALGYNVGTINELRFSQSTPLTNGLLGIKYVLSEKPMGSGYSLLESVRDVDIYKNEAAWPVAFWAPENSLQFDPHYKIGSFELQNQWVSALAGKDITAFSRAGNVKQTLDNMEKTYCDGYLRYDRQVRARAGTVEFELENPERGETFAFLPVYNNSFSPSEVTVQTEVWGRDLGYRSNTIIPLGSDGKQTLKIKAGAPSLHLSGIYFSRLDLNVAKDEASKAVNRALEFTSFSDTEIAGRITAPADGVLATTFPYDDGWTVFVDGKKTDKERIAGVFLAVPLSKGEHIIEMRYSPEGFKAGILISAGTMIGILLWYSRGKKIRIV